MAGVWKLDDDVRAELVARATETHVLALIVGEMLAIVATSNPPAANLFEARLASYAAKDEAAARVVNTVQAGKDFAESRLRAAVDRLGP